MAKLTRKQQRFVDEYLIDLNATQAAIRAGYSEKTAQEQSSRLLSNVMVQEYMQKKMQQREDDLIADQNEVLRYLTAVMRREKTESIVVTLKEKRSFYAPDENGTMRKQTVENEIPKVVEIPARLSDSNKAAELLGKAHCLFTEKVDLEGSTRVVIVDDIENGI